MTTCVGQTVCWMSMDSPRISIGLDRTVEYRQCVSRVGCPWLVQGDPHDYSTWDRQYVGCPWMVLGPPHDYIRGTDST